MAPLPLIKIGAVLWKELAKPLAVQIKLVANSHPSVRRLAMGLGRAHEQASQQLESAWAGKGLLRALKPVSESTAYTVGADLLSQGFMLSTAIGLVYLEYWRSALDKRQTDLNAAAAKAARGAIREARLRDLEKNLAEVQARAAALEQALEDLQAARVVAPQLR